MQRARPALRLGAWGWAALAFAALLTLIAGWGLASTLLPAGLSPITLYGSLVFTLTAPHLALAALIAALVAGTVAHRSRSRAALALAILALVNLAGTAAIIGSVAKAAQAAGGSANPVTALRLTEGARQPDATIEYASPEGHPLHLRVWRPRGSKPAAPILLFIPGGAWISADHTTFAPNATWFSNRGWLVLSVEYRLATPSTPTWDKAPRDVACALAWAVSHATELGGDAGRVAVTGQSTGGNLAVNLGWSAANGTAKSSCPTLGPIPVPNAVVAAYPALDPTLNYWDQPRAGGPRRAGPTDLYLGGTPLQVPERVRAVSSASHLSPRVPPTLVFVPTRDDFVPVAGAYALARMARKAGADVRLVEVPFMNHAFDFAGMGSQMARTVTAHFLRAELGR